jgi:hypothetical protein
VDMASNIAFPAQLGEVAFMLWLVRTYGVLAGTENRIKL